jgi:transaldolase
MLVNKPKTKILVDGGDPEEARRIEALLGFADGQTTNPTLIARNLFIRQRISSGQRLSSQEEKEEYKGIVQTLSPIVEMLVSRSRSLPI